MKLFGYAGTMHNNSVTESYIKDIANKLTEDGIVTDSTIMTGLTAPTSMCRGCVQCFSNGICPNDKLDSMKDIKQELMDSDIIILGSPVYVHDVTATMKNVIDRLAIWMYMCNLCGKTAITVSTATSNGNIFVDRYLSKILGIMGANVAYQFSVTATEGKEFIENKLNECCTKVQDALKNGITEPDKIQESYFLANKKLFSNENLKHFIRDAWLEKGFFEYDDYMSLFNDRMKKEIIR